MEAKLDKLIEKIKREGVQEAKNEADKIVIKAKEEAAAILKEAEVKSAAIIKEAEVQSNKYKDIAKVAIEQAGRDVIISLREKIVTVFSDLLKRDVSNSLNPEVIKSMIVNVLSNWNLDKDNSIEVLISEEDKDSLKEVLISEFKDKMVGGFEFKIHPGLKHGFRIGIKGEDLHYDFSDKGIADVIGLFLNKEIREMVSKSLDG